MSETNIPNIPKFDSRIEKLRARAEAAQYVFNLDPRTLLPLEMAAPVLGKTCKTLRVDVTRCPEYLPRITRIGGQVFIKAGDLIDFISAPAPALLPRGRPSKAKQAQQAQK